MPEGNTTNLFSARPFLIGMVHLEPLPGSPNHEGRFNEAIDHALEDANALQQAGFSALMIENLGDFPYYPDQVPPETVAAMAIVADRVKRQSRLPVGINVLRNDGRSALAIAAVAQVSFIRLNVLTGVFATDQGLLEGKAHLLLRARESLKAREVRILADVRVKHAAPIAPREFAQEIEECYERAMCDAIIISGTGSGKPVEVEFLRQARAAAGARPILLGSGVNESNAAELLAIADGAIIGTSIKVDGKIHNRIDPDRAQRLAEFCRASNRLV